MLEISSTEYLRSHSNSQIRRDFMHFLKMAVNPQPRTVSSFYAGLLPESLVIKVHPDTLNHRTDTMSMTKGDSSDLTTVFTNMLEVLFYMTEVSKESGYRQHQATRLYLFHGKSYEEIGKLLGCHEETARKMVSGTTNKAIKAILKENMRSGQH